jgi:CubicO group peptidase (beta-lactamase class C family)
VRHLLTHTSGIPDYTTDAMDYRKDYTEAELEKMAYGLTLEFPAGARWNYSNTGYVMLGIIARKASGKFYGDLLKERVFAPLGMRTARVISEADIVPNRADGYRLVRGELKNQDWVAPQLNTTADGSLYLSLQDLIAWDKGLRARALLKPESWNQIFGQARLSSGNPYPYGFGWTIDSIGGRLRIHHGGAWQGFKSYIARYMADDLTIIALGNLAQFDPNGFVDGVAKILNPTLAVPELKPIEDREPAVRTRLQEILAQAREGKLTSADFAYVRAGFFPAGARSLQQRLSALSAPRKFTLLDRKAVGDDRVYTYEVEFETTKLLVGLALAPDSKISSFNMRPR